MNKRSSKAIVISSYSIFLIIISFIMIPWFSYFLQTYILIMDIVYLIFIIIADCIYAPMRLTTIDSNLFYAETTARDLYIMGAAILIFSIFLLALLLYFDFNGLYQLLTDFDYLGLLILFVLWGASSILAIIAAVKYGSHH